MEYLIPAILIAAAIVAAVIYATRRPRRPAVIDRARVRRDATAGPLRRLLADTVRELDCAEATIWTISPDGLHLEGALNQAPR
jgi:hypothetical protein